MDTAARLIEVHRPRNAEAVALVLHGGGSRVGGAAVSPTQLSVLRMIPIARRIARIGGRRLAVYRLLNSVRGWDDAHTPVQDVHWALDELARRLGAELPVALVGHSLGGRAALLSADRPEVRSVVGLAPWVYPADGQVDASGTRVLIVHGTADRIASPERSWQAAQRLRRTASSLAYVRVDGGKHAMLARHGEFSGLAADFVAATTLDRFTPSRRVAALVNGVEDAVVV
ncbi:alpha/beta hydrolase [uncultured Jatrophihabitans sp.]|uniref:alpha/beta hydrolase n=1 Tax=uncultured Jatrophihabitans sp. TaxID=1610747 RepID=UPI0035CA0B5A